MGQQLFPQSSNLIWRVLIVLSVPLTVAGFFAGYFIDRSPLFPLLYLIEGARK